MSGLDKCVRLSPGFSAAAFPRSLLLRRWPRLRSSKLSRLLVGTLVSVLFASLAPAHPRSMEISVVELEGSAASGVLTSEALAGLAIERNAGLEAAQAAAEAAAHRIKPAGSLDDPSLSYAAAPATLGSDEGLDHRTEISQRLPWPGTLAARETRARHEALAVERDSDSLRLNIVALAKSAHAEWHYIARALEVHHETHSLLDELISTAEERYAAGRASRQDVLQAEVEQTELKNHELRLLRQQASIQARINALLQRPPDAPLPRAALPPLLTNLPTAENLQQMALAQHPALERLDAEIAANQSEVTLAEKAFYPDFQVGAGYNSSWVDPDKRGTVSISINVPLDRGKRRAELNRARAQVTRAEWSLADRRAQLLADLAEARAEVVEMEGSIARYENELLPLVDDYLSTAIADYRSGSGPFLNVISAEQRKLNTELGLARARSDYARALATLERWAGRSLSAPEGE